MLIAAVQPVLRRESRGQERCLFTESSPERLAGHPGSLIQDAKLIGPPLRRYNQVLVFWIKLGVKGIYRLLTGGFLGPWRVILSAHSSGSQKVILDESRKSGGGCTPITALAGESFCRRLSPDEKFRRGEKSRIHVSGCEVFGRGTKYSEMGKMQTR